MPRIESPDEARALLRRSTTARVLNAVTRDAHVLVPKAHRLAGRVQSLEDRVARLSDLSPAQAEIVNSLLDAAAAAQKARDTLAQVGP